MARSWTFFFNLRYGLNFVRRQSKITHGIAAAEVHKIEIFFISTLKYYNSHYHITFTLGGRVDKVRLFTPPSKI